jgi:transposase
VIVNKIMGGAMINASKKLVKLKTFLTVQQLFGRFRDCQDPMLKTQWQVLWLRAQDKGSDEVAAATGFKADWVRQIVRRYNDSGPDAIRNYVKDNGRSGYLSESQRVELFEVLKKPPADGGLWSGPKVARWVAERTGRDRVCPQTGWEYLRALGFTLQLPRPHHAKAPPNGREEFKKKSRATWRLYASNTQASR